MVVLTDKQRRDLHEALLEYFQTHGLTQSWAALTEELEAKGPFPAAAAAAAEAATALEKKWGINVRLQQKVLDLEAQVRRLEQDLVDVQDPEALKRKAADGLPCAPPKFVLEGHRESVTCVVFHPRQPVVVSGSEDATLRVWDYETGAFERALRGHLALVTAVDCDPSGQRVASASADTTVRVWDFASGHCMRTLQGHDHSVSDVRFLPSPTDGLLSCSRDGTLRLWDAHSGYVKRVLRGHDDWVRTVAVSGDGALVASGGDDQTLRLWDLATGKQLQVFTEPTHTLECVLFSTPRLDAALLQARSPAAAAAAAQANGVAHNNGPAPPPRPQHVIAGGRDKLIRAWDLATGAVVLSLAGHGDWVRAVVVHPGGRFLLSAGDDKTIRVWDVATGRAKKTYADAHPHFISGLALPPGGQPLLASCSVDKTVRLWACK